MPATLRVLLVACAVAAVASAGPSRAESRQHRLPDGLLVGAGTSAIQSEGAWNEDGKAESLADSAVRKIGWPGSPNVSSDSYHRYKEDIEMAAQLKLSLYKFTISWARILPTGNANEPNQKGVEHYHNVIDEVLKKGMVPMITLYHFDHPYTLEKEFGGWTDQRMIAKFEEYAKFVFAEYAGKVDLWVTINEPNMYCAYFLEIIAITEKIPNSSAATYNCLHNNVLAHLAAFKAFKDGGYKGKVGLSAFLIPAEAATTSVEDEYAREAFAQMNAGTTLYPVVYGDYPQMLKNLVGSKLPVFTDAEKRGLVGASDFIGLNLYFSMTTAYNRFYNSSSEGMQQLLGRLANDLRFVEISSGTSTASSLSSIDPTAMHKGLLWAWQQYRLPIVICENGYGDSDGYGIKDDKRVEYHSGFLRALVETVEDHGVEVLAYSAWSLVDSYEFTAGFNRRFGLVHVDFESGNLTRTLKDSHWFWQQLAETRIVPVVESSSASRASVPLLACLAAVAVILSL